MYISRDVYQEKKMKQHVSNWPKSILNAPRTVIKKTYQIESEFTRQN
jgi:hypothetical protein